MEGYAHRNEFCLNEACQLTANFKKISRNRILKIVFTRSGVKRDQCKTCNSTFIETRGTIFYSRRTPEHQILETLRLLAEGTHIGSLTCAIGYRGDSILEWLREAASQSEQVEGVLMRDFKVKLGQLDALWGLWWAKNLSRG